VIIIRPHHHLPFHIHQLIRTFFADPAWLPGFTKFETTAEPDALLAKVKTLSVALFTSPDNLANSVAASGRNGQAIQKIG
jgi:hypothetical protein